MIYRILFICSFIITSLHCQPTTTIQKKASSISPANQADLLAKKVFENEKFPGMAVLVWQKDEILFSNTYGYADVENKIPIDVNESLFRIGSVSKPYTAAALGILYENRMIDLDVPIQTYVPDFPEKKHPVTLRQLAGHLAGIRHYRGMEFMSNKHYPTVNEGLEIFAADTLLHTPGSKYAYSSYGWNLISAAIESVAGKDFLNFMKEDVFEEIGMNNTYADNALVEMEERVQYYQKGLGGAASVAPKVDNSYKWAGGGFISSPMDVVKFAEAHLEHSILTPTTMSEWTKSQNTTSGKPTNYGIGWRSTEDNKGRKWYGHSGGSVGGTTMMLIYPEEELIVVTVVNLSSAKMGNLAFRIANQFLAK